MQRLRSLGEPLKISTPSRESVFQLRVAFPSLRNDRQHGAGSYYKTPNPNPSHQGFHQYPHDDDIAIFLRDSNETQIDVVNQASSYRRSRYGPAGRSDIE